MSPFQKIHILVLDSVGIGEAPDAEAFGDAGADTLGHIADSVEGLHLPHLQALGLGNIRRLRGIPPVAQPQAFFGAMQATSQGKDSMTGHWEMSGLVLSQGFPTFPNGFPDALLAEISRISGRAILGNIAASGTAIINQLGAEHLKTGALIVYTSADPVLQIAAHEDIVPVADLHAICAQCREITQTKPHLIGRIIARPFTGSIGAFVRTANRHDYPLSPPGFTVLNTLADAGLDVVGIGKISEIFNHSGITRSIPTKSNRHGMQELTHLVSKDFHGITFTNLVDFDSIFGHRRDMAGYARALSEFDAQLPCLLDALGMDDLLMITADHGNDPTFRGSDHTRERVPLLAFTPRRRTGTSLGARQCFADIAATIADNFRVRKTPHGNSFIDIILAENQL